MSLAHCRSRSRSRDRSGSPAPTPTAAQAAASSSVRGLAVRLEDLRAPRPRVDDLALGELQLLGLGARDLRPEPARRRRASARRGPRTRGARSARSSPPRRSGAGACEDLDVVRAHEQRAEPVDRRRRSSSRTPSPGARRGRAARPACSTWPSFITTICSATSIASSWSWVTKIVVTWTSSWRRRSHARSSLRTFASRAPNGSSSSSTLRLDRERPGERHALALAAGELRRVAVGEALEVDQAQQLVDALARSPPSAACGSSARRRRCRARSCA